MAARFEWRTSLSAADFPATAYEALRLRVTDHTPFNSLGWLRAAEQALGEGERLHILLAWETDELCLCLPLVASRERFGGVDVSGAASLGLSAGRSLGTVVVCLGSEDMREALVQIRQRCAPRTAATQ
jgi:hypothetical protein